MEKVSGNRTTGGEGAVQRRTTSTPNTNFIKLWEFTFGGDEPVGRLFIRADLWEHISCTVDVKLLS